MAELVAAILEDEDVDPLDVDVDLMEADRVPLRKIPSNVGIVDVEITSLKSAERNLINLSGDCYLILIFLPHVLLLRVLHLLFLALPLLYCRGRGMIDSDR